MKWHRVMLVAGVLAMAACSSPTIPKVPAPDEDPNKPDPEHPGFVVPVVQSVLPGIFTG